VSILTSLHVPLRPARKALEQELAVIHNGTLTTVDLRGHIQRVVEETSAMPCMSLRQIPIAASRSDTVLIARLPDSIALGHSDVQYD
jgi:hypothetical protein